MDKKKIKIFFKLYWIRIVILTILTLLGLSFIWLVTVGIQSFITMEAYYRKVTMAQMAFQLYTSIFYALIFSTIHMAFYYYVFFGGGLTKMGKKRVKPEDVNVGWKDVVGMASIKKEVWEVIQLIRDHSRVKLSGGKIIKGVLLAGPPGCGKTYLAKAIATEAKLPFLHASGSEFRGMFVGTGTSRIKSLFKEARTLSALHDGCLIFIDEIDTIARPRVTPGGFVGGGMDYNATVNQLLTEMDGLATSKDNIVVIAATNVLETELDQAVMRPGRFDRKIYVGLPGLDDREQLLRYYFSKVSYVKEKIVFNKLSRLTVGNTPADIANMVREASLISLRKRKTALDMSDVNEARERILLGVKADIVLSVDDKKIAASHEAGHAMVAYLMVPTQDVFKASIVPRKGIGGTTWIMETEERFIPNKEDLLGKIRIALGGYAAEKIQFGLTSTGVEADLKTANKLANNMVTKWGMGTSGPGGVSEQQWVPSHIAERDKEDIINSCLNEINDILRKEKAILDTIMQGLLKKEELDYDELEDIFKKAGKTRLTYTQKDIAGSKKDGVTWDDVIGMDQAKEEAKEMVSLIKDRVMLKQVGGQIIKGLLLFGPPGCGKTYLASAIANETGVPFLTKSGSEFVEMYVGVGASRIRHLFQEAREKALAKGGCIIFIDEIDALGAKRSMDRGFGGTSEHNQTLNQFLVEMDGLKDKDAQSNVIVVGATNIDEEHMDPALMRAGRFDRKIYVDLPTFDERKKLFEYYLGKIKYNPKEIDPEKFSGITQGWSPAEIANLIKEAALLSVRNKKTMTGLKEIEEARERIELGLKRPLSLNKDDLEKTAYHEAGHCIAQYFFGEPSFKISIIPRKGGIMGVAWSGGMQSDKKIYNRNELLGKINIALAGYAAEKIKFGVTANGVYSDFTSAMQIAHSMVWEVGMGKSGYIGNFSAVKELSGEMRSKLDTETQELLQDSLKVIDNLLQKESKLLDSLSKALLDKEELNYFEVEEIFKTHGKKRPQKKLS